METKIYSIQEYSEKIKIQVGDLYGKSRSHKISTPRQIYWYYLSLNKIPVTSICKEFNRKHSTILEGIKKINGYIDVKDKTINSYLNALSIFSQQ